MLWNHPVHPSVNPPGQYPPEHEPLHHIPHEQGLSPGHQSHAVYERRESLQLETFAESGTNFPGCFILVPSTEPEDTLSAPHTFANHQTGDLNMEKPRHLNTKKVRRPLPEAERAEIRKNRKQGVCVRCKMFKERVCHLPFVCKIPAGLRIANFHLTRCSAEEVSHVSVAGPSNSGKIYVCLPISQRNPCTLEVR